MKILFFADLHVKSTGPIQQWNRLETGGVTGEISRSISSGRFIASAINSEKPDLVVCLGDVLHPQHSIDTPTMVWAQRIMRAVYAACNACGSEFWLVPGNHDVHSAGMYSAEIFRYDNFFLAPNVVEFHGLRIGVAPYFDPESGLWESITKMAKEKNIDVMFTHSTFKGAWTWSDVFDSGPDPNLCRVITGHIHIPQQVGNVRYVGSVHQCLPSETARDIPHGVLVVDTDSWEYRQIKNESVKTIATIRGIEDLGGLHPESDFIRAVVPESAKDEVEKILASYGFEYSLFPIPEAIKVESIPDTAMKDSMQIIDEFIANNFPYLTDTMKWVKVRFQ